MASQFSQCAKWGQADATRSKFAYPAERTEELVFNIKRFFFCLKLVFFVCERKGVLFFLNVEM